MCQDPVPFADKSADEPKEVRKMRKRIVSVFRATARRIEVLLEARVPMGVMFGLRTR